QLDGEVGPPVRCADPLEDGLAAGQEARVCLVDPVPGEIADSHRRHTKPVGRGESQWGNVADDELDVEGAEPFDFGFDACLERLVEVDRRRDSGRIVVADARGLDDARVARPLEERPGHPQGAAEEARVDAGSDDNGTAGIDIEVIDDLDVTRRVPETVAGYVEDDGHGARLRDCEAARLRDCKATRLQGHEATRPRGYEATRPRGDKATRLRGREATRLQGY